jgi:hypothetical protein
MRGKYLCMILMTLFSTLLLGNDKSEAASWKLGTDYLTLDMEHREKNTIRIFSSFWNVNSKRCQSLHTYIEKNLPEPIKVLKYQLYRHQFTPQKVYDESVNLFIFSKIRNIQEKFSDFVYKQHFDYTGDRKIMSYSPEDWRSFMLFNGPLAGLDYDKKSKSFAFKALVKRHNKVLLQYKNKLNTVPSFIVNDKYQVKLKQSDCLKAPDPKLLELVRWLIKNETF